MPAVKGVAVAMVNLVVVALAIGWVESPRERDPLALAELVAICGFLPAFACGAIVGVLAGLRASAPPLARLCWLAPLPLGVVWMLGTASGGTFLIARACVPTCAAVALLERWTRRVPDPPVPPARVAT